MFRIIDNDGTSKSPRVVADVPIPERAFAHPNSNLRMIYDAKLAPFVADALACALQDVDAMKEKHRALDTE